jgi:hypothetical protein
MKIED